MAAGEETGVGTCSPSFAPPNAAVTGGTGMRTHAGTGLTVKLGRFPRLRTTACTPAA